MGLKGSSLETSILALVHLGTSTITDEVSSCQLGASSRDSSRHCQVSLEEDLLLRTVLDSSANRGMSLGAH